MISYYSIELGHSIRQNYKIILHTSEHTIMKAAIEQWITASRAKLKTGLLASEDLDSLHKRDRILPGYVPADSYVELALRVEQG